MSRELFVGRTREAERYQKFLSKETPWIMMIRGLGGGGKSTLLAEFERQTPRDTCVITLDFAQRTLREDYLTFLEHFSQQVESYCDPERTVELRKSIATGRYEIGKRIAGGITTIEKIEQGMAAEADASIAHAEQTIELGEPGIQETRHQMREAARERFYAQMKTFSAKRLVILLDTCEWLTEDTPETQAARWAGTELIKELRSRMHHQGKLCYVVMASRLPLSLEGINEAEQEHVKLKMLDRAAVNAYVEDMQIHNPLIQDYIYAMTYGHPHSIAILYNIWEENWDTPLTVADLPALKEQFYERALQEIIDKDIFKRLLKSPLDELTRYGVLLRRFNLPLLQAVFKEWLPEPEARTRFEQLITYPHVEPLGNFNYVFHILLREVLAGYIRVQEPEKWKRYHQLALAFLKSELAQTSTSPDWYYHLLACDEAQGVSYWNEIITREPQEYINALREMARDKTLKLTLATVQRIELQPDTTSSSA